MPTGLRWIGSALPAVGLSAGTGLSAAQYPAAAALMAARHPHTGRRLLAETGAPRNRGYEITLAAPASLSTLHALAAPEVAASITALVMQALTHSLSRLEKHLLGRARRAGVMGWLIVYHHTPALPDRPPRPCLHGHLEAMEVAAASRIRRLLSTHHGVRWQRDAASGRWEIVSAGAQLYARSPTPPPGSGPPPPATAEAGTSVPEVSVALVTGPASAPARRS
ncbi:relaxase domain-containing protein [Planobispora siamensis]|uniref:relaxase domain-containing protein n=1 Tax=Planobispora siamensis TaxID=936338 RepID=UPI00194FD113|nr:relaxase domain-containing protein [Planobispora siamensis]